MDHTPPFILPSGGKNNGELPMHSVESIELIAQDGTRLRGLHYFVENPRARIVVASATGVPQAFYRHFAR